MSRSWDWDTAISSAPTGHQAFLSRGAIPKPLHYQHFHLPIIKPNKRTIESLTTLRYTLQFSAKFRAVLRHPLRPVRPNVFSIRFQFTTVFLTTDHRSPITGTPPRPGPSAPHPPYPFCETVKLWSHQNQQLAATVSQSHSFAFECFDFSAGFSRDSEEKNNRAFLHQFCGTYRSTYSFTGIFSSRWASSETSRICC